MDKQTNTDGGASIGRDVNTAGGNVIGRDQHNIQNIIIVGRFFEFAQAQNLFPNISSQVPFENIRDAIDGVFAPNLNSDLAAATAFAGEMLKDILADWIALQTGLHISLRLLLIGLAKELYAKLKTSGYWDIHRETGGGSYSYYEMLRLESTDTLWTEQFYDANFSLIYEIKDKFTHEISIDFTKNGNPFITDVEQWSLKEQRMFLVGIVLDLIRIHSQDKLNLQFLRELIDSLETFPSKDKNEKA